MKKLFKSLEKTVGAFYPTFCLYHYLYKPVVEKEVELAGITKEDTVLNIGCGAIPFTALHIVQMTGAKVIALDKDPEAVRMAQHYLKKYGLDKNIEIRVGNGSPEKLPSFTVALIALHIKDKEQMLKNLKNVGSDGGRIVFRQPVEAYREEYGGLCHLDEVHGKVFQNMKTFKQSYLFVLSSKGSSQRRGGETS
ncbi:class I SAM-dependent methyltransferase [Tindallia californiensis]|uniref:Methyltransferase domain-containing protein n=1 Tax=Tindallia californiensis TaxID=159292 RepID=A0A1H3QTP1_9FIRM|nr:class I SAM-dependent methyltransferase [Tindallia californiensis]SDZ16797.1 Methyltransferase domain-containing protein [Tindallia californiensis]